MPQIFKAKIIQIWLKGSCEDSSFYIGMQDKRFGFNVFLQAFV